VRPARKEPWEQLEHRARLVLQAHKVSLVPLVRQVLLVFKEQQAQLAHKELQARLEQQAQLAHKELPELPVLKVFRAH
jgi:hypothetical protein